MSEKSGEMMHGAGQGGKGMKDASTRDFYHHSRSLLATQTKEGAQKPKTAERDSKMKSTRGHHFYWIFIFACCAFGLNIVPDSISKSVVPSYFNLLLDTITLKNQSNTVIVVDSVLIRFQNGVDSRIMSVSFPS